MKLKLPIGKGNFTYYLLKIKYQLQKTKENGYLTVFVRVVGGTPTTAEKELCNNTSPLSVSPPTIFCPFTQKLSDNQENLLQTIKNLYRFFL